MLRKLWYSVLILTLFGGTLIAFSSPAAAAGVYTIVARCEIVRPGPVVNFVIENATQFRVSSAGRVHVNSVTSRAYALGIVDLRLDYDLRFKDTNGLLQTWTSTGGERWIPINGETIRGLKTTVRGWNYDLSKSCNATAISR
jgi:hypothetical protein